MEYNGLRESATNIVERDKALWNLKKYERYRNMKGCIREANFERQGW